MTGSLREQAAQLLLGWKQELIERERNSARDDWQTADIRATVELLSAISLREAVPVAAKPWLTGKPYYCKLCGAGFAEYGACGQPDCELESEADAVARRDAATPPTVGETDELIQRLAHAIATASNDDYSEAGGRERARHVERIDTMRAAVDRIEQLTAELATARDTRKSYDSFMEAGRKLFEDRYNEHKQDVRTANARSEAAERQLAELRTKMGEG